MEIKNRYKIKQYYSFIYLLIGFICLFFANGRWILPITAIIAPLFLIRFLHFQKPFIGFLFVLFIGWISNILIWKGMMPMDGFLYYLISFNMSLFTSLVYLTDRICSRRIRGFKSTLIFPSAYVLMEFIVVSTIPSGTFGAIAHTQTNLPFLQILSVTGIWGVSFILLWTARVVNWLWDNIFEISHLKKATIFYGLPIIIVLLFGQIRIHLMPNDADTVRIAAVTLDKNLEKEYYSITENEEFDRLYAKIGQSFIESCEKAVQAGAEIIFGQETLLGIWHENEEDYLEKIKQISLRDSVYIGLSIALITEEARNNQLPGKNKITWISPKGKTVAE